ncbi:sugar transferase [[Clostridium] symbiosum]|nr:sugar transferase [[Clostridium] symbiosum]MCB6610932.1 sugar transferase [[Clostridium] symbiosum]MCB6931622.1 sugar transferase [[Clostridium] symbiosum]
MICSWEKLPHFMRTEEVRPYYEILRRRRISLMMKRTFDFVMSSVLLVLLSPLFLILSIWIHLDSPGSVFYRQERITQYGRTFRIYKFRTMVQNADKIGSLVTVGGDSRITKVGQKLRGCRLDEIPQLINIWKGEMTFVGTRPEVAKYVKWYTKEMYATLLLPAGVTSEASIEFKDEDRILVEKTAEGKSVDEAYLEDVLREKMRWNLSALYKCRLSYDIKILIKTMRAVI